MRKIIIILLSVILLLQTDITIFAENDTDEIPNENYGRGLAEMSEEQLNEFHSKLPMISDIAPNSIAMSRISQNTESNIQNFSDNISTIPIAELGDEMTYSLSGQSTGGAISPSEFPLTSKVDVSASLTFPPICNQGQINSCIPWSMVYYQLTNNNCVVRGLNAKTQSGTAIKQNIMSPRFIYPLINGGLNVSAYHDEACAAIMSYGAPNVNDLPANINSANIRSWCTSSDIWNSAIYNKPNRIAYGIIDTSSVVNAETTGVVNLKKILSNGYVVTIPTYVDSFIYTRNTTGSVWGCRYVANTKRGRHAMTVVGYDDNFWIDVNNNNSKDSGETGAFKIANSWGTNVSKYTKGYVWMPYDALGEVSAVPGASTARVSAFEDYYFIEPKKDYMPLLIANVQLTTDKRNQVSIKLGISDSSSDLPKMSISPTGSYHIAFNESAKCLLAEEDNLAILDKNFSGGNGIETITIPFDLTLVIKKVYKSTGLGANSNVKLYVEVTDSVDNGSTVTLGDITITEPMTGKEIACSDKQKRIANNSSVAKTVEFQITPIVGYSETQDITLTFNSNLQSSSVDGNLFLKTPDNQIIIPEYLVTDNNKIKIYSPKTNQTDGYLNDRKYELHLKTPIKSMGGNHLDAEKIIYIYILDKFYVYY